MPFALPCREGGMGTRDTTATEETGKGETMRIWDKWGRQAGRISVVRLHGEVFSFSLGGENSLVDLSGLKPGGFKEFHT